MKLILLTLLVSTFAFSQECTHYWDAHLDTNPFHLKLYAGDTSTAYSIFSFWGDPGTAFEIRGNFPKARFMSLESQNTRLSFSEDALFDYQIEPDEGSTNPFKEGEHLNAEKRAFTVLVTQHEIGDEENTIRLPRGILAQSIMLRIYSPNEGVEISKNDLPRIFAVDSKTGAPVQCPKKASYPDCFHFPQLLAEFYSFVSPFEFKVPGEGGGIAGLNKAADYMYALSRMPFGKVMTFKFKSPTWANTQSGTGTFPVGDETRYWSFCTNSFPTNETLNCLPDYLSVPKEGFVYIAIGRGENVKKSAEAQGYHFLPDVRRSNQKVMGFVYRNLFASEAFKKTNLFKGDYVPAATLCSGKSFISGRCGELSR